MDARLKYSLHVQTLDNWFLLELYVTQNINAQINGLYVTRNINVQTNKPFMKGTN